jgi:hypothetical protein
MSITTDKTFGTGLVQSLIEQGGYATGHAPATARSWGCSKQM